MTLKFFFWNIFFFYQLRVLFPLHFRTMPLLWTLPMTKWNVCIFDLVFRKLILVLRWGEGIHNGHNGHNSHNGRGMHRTRVRPNPSGSTSVHAQHRRNLTIQVCVFKMYFFINWFVCNSFPDQYLVKNGTKKATKIIEEYNPRQSILVFQLILVDENNFAYFTDCVRKMEVIEEYEDEFRLARWVTK
jgi:hypothetical protein